MANSTNSLSHTKWVCKYHIVIVPKYRRKVIYKEKRKDLQEIIRTLCKYKGVEILEGHMMPDHVHLLLSIPAKTSVSSFMGYLKGKSALMMIEKHANLKYKFGNRHFWAEGYYVSTVGLNEDTIRKYAGKETDKMFTDVDFYSFIKEADKEITAPPRKLSEQVKRQIELLGYVTIADEKYKRMASVVEIDTKYSPRL